MYHFADPVEHGIGVAIVDDFDDLDRAIAKVQAYEGLRLPELARATGARLPALAERFIDNCSWPPGTDTPTPYLLKLSGVRKTLGTLFLPDLQGGSFRTIDGPARAVLEDPDGCIIMVNPSRYASNAVDAKRYRDAVDTQVQRCVTKHIPAAIMITKADAQPPENQGEADKTHMRLERVVGNDVDSIRIFRVSVLGDDVSLDEKAPPSADARKPTALIHAWAWLLTEAICTPPPKTRVPPVKLAATLTAPRVLTSRLAEVRKIGEFSSPPGRVLCNLREGKCTTFALSGDGGVLVATLPELGAKPEVQPLGRTPGLDHDQCLHAESRDGCFFIGPAHETNAIWHGHIGDELTKVGLPLTMKTWVTVGERHLVAVDDSGRLHLLVRASDRWEQTSYFADFVEKSSKYICAYLEREHAIVVGNGSEVAAIELNSDGFGDKFEYPNSLEYQPNEEVKISKSGLAVICSSENDLFFTLGSSSFESETRLFNSQSLALHNDLPLLAGIDSKHELHVFKVSSENVVDASHPVSAPDSLTGLVWGRAPLLLATFDESWAVFQARGFDDA